MSTSENPSAADNQQERPKEEQQFNVLVEALSDLMIDFRRYDELMVRPENAETRTDWYECKVVNLGKAISVLKGRAYVDALMSDLKERMRMINLLEKSSETTRHAPK